MTTFIAMCLFALVTSISPGPVNFIATSTGAHFGFQRAIPHILGATIGFTSILVLMGAGLLEVIESNPSLINYIRFPGSLFLLFMSYKIAFSCLQKEASFLYRSPPVLLEGLFCQWLNPKAWIVALSGITAFSQDMGSGYLNIALFGSSFFIICFFSISIWALAGHLLQKHLNNTIHFRVFNYTMGGLLALTAIYLLF